MTPTLSAHAVPAPTPHLIGRGAELAFLDEAMSRAADGFPAAVLVGGEAGVGKSRLLREFASRRSASGAYVLHGSCIDLGSGDLPYGPLADALHKLVRDLGADLVRDRAGSAFPEIARLVPFLVEANPAEPDPGPQSRSRLFQGVLRLLDRLGADMPVLLMVEDLQWADRSTLDLLSFLIRAARDERLLVVGSYRSSDLHPRHPLRAVLAEFDLTRRVQRFELSRFTKAELAEFLTALLGVPPRRALVRRVHELSDGNAFFAEELIVAAGPGAATSDGQEALAVVPLPLRDVVLSRVELLGEDAQEVLRAAATAGRQISHPLLARVCDLPERRLLNALRECVARHLLVTNPAEQSYVFRHALAREAVYGDLLPGERVRLHAALAEALATDRRLSHPDDLTTAVELAYHWHEAGESARALVASVRAGDVVARASALAESERQFTRAIELWPRVDDPERLAGISWNDLLSRAADAARWAGHVETAVQRIHQALAGVDPEVEPARAGSLYERLGRFLWEAGDNDGSDRAYGEARRVLEAVPPGPVLARVLAGQAHALVLAGRYSPGLQQGLEAIEMARAVDARAEEGRALNTTGLALTMTGNPDAGVDALRQAVEIAESTGQIEDLYRAYGNLSFVLENAGRLRESLAVSQRAVERSRQSGLDLTAGGVLMANGAAVLSLLGQWDEAAAVANDALDREIPSGFALYLHLVLAEIEIARGHFENADRWLANAQQMARRQQEPHFIGPLHACRAELALWRRQHLAARTAVADGLAAMDDVEDAPQVLRLCALGLRAEADEASRLATLPRPSPADRQDVHHAGESLALAALKLVETFHGRTFLPESDGLGRLCMAEHARLDGRAEPGAWAELAGFWERLERPYPAAYARWRQVEAVFDAGEPVPVTLLRDVHRRSVELGAGPLRQEIEVLARWARVELAEPGPPAPRQARQQQPFGLTFREREVLRHLTEGHSNRQIAQALYITEKTASVHVSNILMKLSVPSRGAAAAVAHRLGLDR